jgi:DNA polymerase-3 subunit epsilon
VESYNERVVEAIRSLQQEPSFAIVEEGREPGEKSCVLVQKGQFWGMGYLPEDFVIDSLHTLQEALTPLKESMYVRNLVLGYAAANPDKLVPLNHD